NRVDVQREPGRATTAHLYTVTGERPVEAREDEGGRARRVPGRMDHFHRNVAAQADALTTSQRAVGSQLAREVLHQQRVLLGERLHVVQIAEAERLIAIGLHVRAARLQQLGISIV